jgi:hypothetical protein
MASQSSNLLTRFALVCIFAALMFLGGTSTGRADNTPPNPYDTALHIDFMPYAWLPSITATLRQPLVGITGPNGQPIAADPLQTFDTQVGPTDYFSKINFGAQGALIAHYGQFALYADFQNVNVGSGVASVRNIGRTDFTFATQAQFQAVFTSLTIAPAVTVYHSRVAELNVLIGSQTLWLSENGNAQVTGPLGNTFSGGFNKAEHYGAVVAGFAGNVALGGKWSAPYFVDYGFSSPNSIQWFAGVKYGKTLLTWRTVQFNSTNPNTLLQHLNLTGLMLGYTLPIL